MRLYRRLFLLFIFGGLSSSVFASQYQTDFGSNFIQSQEHIENVKEVAQSKYTSSQEDRAIMDKITSIIVDWDCDRLVDADKKLEYLFGELITLYPWEGEVKIEVKEDDYTGGFWVNYMDNRYERFYFQLISVLENEMIDNIHQALDFDSKLTREEIRSIDSEIFGDSYSCVTGVGYQYLLLPEMGGATKNIFM